MYVSCPKQGWYLKLIIVIPKNATMRITMIVWGCWRRTGTEPNTTLTVTNTMRIIGNYRLTKQHTEAGIVHEVHILCVVDSEVQRETIRAENSKESYCCITYVSSSPAFHVRFHHQVVIATFHVFAVYQLPIQVNSWQQYYWIKHEAQEVSYGDQDLWWVLGRSTLDLLTGGKVSSSTGMASTFGSFFFRHLCSSLGNNCINK